LGLARRNNDFVLSEDYGIFRSCAEQTPRILHEEALSATIGMSHFGENPIEAGGLTESRTISFFAALAASGIPAWSPRKR
jgi:hypothetical protein